jgi:hypothetical protein
MNAPVSLKQKGMKEKPQYAKASVLPPWHMAGWYKSSTWHDFSCYLLAKEGLGGDGIAEVLNLKGLRAGMNKTRQNTY